MANGLSPSTWFQPYGIPQGAQLGDLTSSNDAISKALYDRLGQYGSQLGQVYGNQNMLGGNLYGAIQGIGPSVAGAQLQQGVGDIAQQQQAQASGATGVNGALARYGAMMNTGQAQAQANQAASVARVLEQAHARDAYGQLLAQQAQGVNTAAGIATQGAGQAGGNAVQAGAKNEEERNRLAGQNLDFWSNLIHAGASGAAAYGSSGASLQKPTSQGGAQPDEEPANNGIS